MRPAMVIALLLSATLCRADPPPASKHPRNPYLVAALRLYADLEFEKSLEQLGHARNVPGTSTEEMAQIEIYTGLIQFNLGHPDPGRSSFSAALALDPNAQLDESVSPKVRAEWTAIRDRLNRIERAQTPQAQHSVPPATPPVDLSPSTSAAPAPLAGSDAATSPVTTFGPFAVMGAGVVLGGVGGAFGIAANGAASSAKGTNVQLSINAYDQTASHDALAANILFAAAGAAVVGGVIWLIAR